MTTDEFLGRCGMCGQPLHTAHFCTGTLNVPPAYPPAYYSGRIAQLEADLAAARAEAARLRDLVDAARNILQSIVKSPCEAEIREWLAAVEER